MSNFTSAEKVLQCIRAGDNVESVRGRNRGKVLDAANCVPPLDEDTAEKLGIKINVNWGELLEILCKARGQLLSAFLGNQFFFTVKLPLAPAEHQSEWEQFITNCINRPLRESMEYFELHRSRWSSVVTHGVGPMMWKDKEGWLPRFRSMADLRIPTDTTLDFSNLAWFATREPYTPLELVEEVFNDKPNNKWDKKAVAKILKTYKELNFTDATNNYDIETEPEKYLELFHQNGGFYGSDAVPTIPLWHFYFKDEGGWFMRIVPDNDAMKESSKEGFLWQSDDREGASWKEIIHCQYGDLSVDPPFKYHGVRGLGFVLLEPTFYMNLTRCRLLQHVHDNFNIWLKSMDNAEKARVSVQEFGNLGVVSQGLSIVPQNERHQIAAQLVEMVFGQLTQLQANASSSYTQQPDTGTNKEQTAFETRVKMEQVNAMMGAILMTAFKYESYAYREICRRFCRKDSTDEDVKKFQRLCEKAGIPRQWLDIDFWDVDPVTPLGMGNPTIAQAAAQQLMQLRPMMNPQAQEEVLHENVLIITKDPRKAARWVPVSGKPNESDAKREMVGYFAALMRGAKIPLSQANLVDQCEALLPLYAGEIALITKRNNMAAQDEATGLATVSDYLGRAIKQLSQDQTLKEKVKEYEDIKMTQDNLARGLIQRGQEAQKKQAQQNGNAAGAEMAAKVQGEKAMLQTRLQGKQAETAQTLKHRELEFNQQMRHKDIEGVHEQHRKDLETASGIRHDTFKALAAAHHQRLKSIPTDDEES